MLSAALFSSKTHEHPTPTVLMTQLRREFPFTVDVCATAANAKCDRYFTKETDGLKQSWAGETCWMNCPYGSAEYPCKAKCKKKRCMPCDPNATKCIERRCNHRGHHISEYIPGAGDWVAKAFSESRFHGATVVCLLPARTDTSWFHKYCLPHAAEIRFIEGRLNYGDVKNSAPFPSILVIFRPPVVQEQVSTYAQN